MAERQFGPYLLVRQIAVGGMAEIHLAKTSGIAGFEKYVALKMIHPNFSEDQQFIEMLIDEAKITVLLQHVNVAQTFDLGRVDKTYYITMEYVDGADLYKLLRKGSEHGMDVPVPVAAYVAKEVATGLDYAHRKRDVSRRPLGIVHRDISPQNVLISYAGEIKLVDFGIAKATMRARQTAVGVIKGKYYYMSPEQAWGDPLDRRTDIFSTGILLYEMLTGQMLYLEEDLHKLLDMVRKAQIEPPTTLRRDIPPQLERIVMHCLQKRPEDRYEYAGDLATDLERFLHAYAPVFTAAKVSAWIGEVLSDELDRPVAVAPPEEVPDKRRETKRLTRDQIVLARDEIADENSVIFNVAELMAQGAAEEIRDDDDDDQPTDESFGGSRRAPTNRSASGLPPMGNGARSPRRLDEPTKRPGQPLLTRPSPPPQPPARRAGAIEVKPPRAPTAPARRSWSEGPVAEARDAHVATQQIIDAEAPTEMSGPAMGGLSDMDDATVISEPPTFNLDDPPEDLTIPEDVDRQVPHLGAMSDPTGLPLEMRGVGQPPGLPGNSDLSSDPGVDEEAPTVAAGLAAQAGGEDETDATRLDVRAAPGDDEPNRASWEKLPALAAANPSPAVSAIRQPRRSRKTPPEGVDPNQPSAPSVLSSLLHKGAERVPHVALSTPSRPGESNPTAFPPTADEAASYSQALPLAPTTQHTPGPFPGMNPPRLTTTKQLAAIELDEIPDQFKISHRRNPWLLWGGVALLVALITGAVIAGAVGNNPGPMSASFEIISAPDGATVYVDGKRLDNPTPTLLSNVEPGRTYLIVVDLPGYQGWEKEERVPEQGGNLKVVAGLDKIVVTLAVESDPSQASVYLNYNPVGQTPLELTDLDPATATNLEIRKKGYRPVHRKLDWANETVKKLQFTLER